MGWIKSLRTVAMHLRLGQGPGVVQSLLRRGFRGATGRQTVNDFDGNLTVDLDLAEHMQRRIFWMGYYNLHLVALLNRVLAPGMVVVDVGANIGEVSLVCANRVGATGRVIAFEPVETIAEEFQRNVLRNGLGSVIHLCRQGLADKAGRFSIYGSCGQFDTDESNRGLGSLHGNPARDPVLGVVEVVRLDDVIGRMGLERLDVLKIDIEGGELACLKGALVTLERFRPIVVVEVQEHSASNAGYRGRDILDLLLPFGYQFHRLEANGQLVPISVNDLTDYQDVVCMPGADLAAAPRGT